MPENRHYPDSNPFSNLLIDIIWKKIQSIAIYMFTFTESIYLSGQLDSDIDNI